MKEKLAELYYEAHKIEASYTSKIIDAFIAGWEAKEASIDMSEIKEAVVYELENIIDYWFDGETPNYEKVEFKLKMRKQIDNIFNSPLTKGEDAK